MGPWARPAAQGLELGSTGRRIVDEQGRAGLGGAGEVERLVRREVAALEVVVPWIRSAASTSSRSAPRIASATASDGPVSPV